MPIRVVIDHCVIAVSDWNRSNAFYRDVLGAELVARGNGCVYRFGGQYLSVHGPEDDVPYTAREPVRPGNSDLCFEWPGTIEEAVEHLSSHDVEVEAGPLGAKGPLGRDGRHVYFRDPDGSLLEFVSYA